MNVLSGYSGSMYSAAGAFGASEKLMRKAVTAEDAMVAAVADNVPLTYPSLISHTHK